MFHLSHTDKKNLSESIFRNLKTKKFGEEQVFYFDIKRQLMRRISMSNPLFRTYLTAPWKTEYVKRNKDPNQCVLCAIAQKTPGVDAWEVFRDDQIMVLLNRFPYNPGHLLIAPLEHYEKLEILPGKLVTHLTLMLQQAIKLLNFTHNPMGFNIGLNLGDVAGRSIKHVHWHVVPRYLGDLNFMEILKTRVLTETLEQTLSELRPHNNVFSQKHDHSFVNNKLPGKTKRVEGSLK